MTVEPESPPDSTETPGGDAEERSTERRSASRAALAVIGHLARRCAVSWRPLLATSTVVSSIGAAAGLFFFQYRPEQQISDAAAHTAIQAASDGAVAAVSYSYDHLDRDFAKAKSLLTGKFLAYYAKFSEEYVGPAARQGKLTATAKVVRAALSELNADSAVVLVFLNQNTASAEKPQPLTTASSVSVSMTKVNGSWLIAKLDPQ